MSNLIIAVIGVAFASLLMLAGVNYLSPQHSVVATTAGQSVIDVEELTSDYDNLAMNLGRRPTPSDYTAVFNGQSQSTAYSSSGGIVAKAGSLPGNNGGWVFTPNCGGGASNADCFVMTVDGTGLGGSATAAGLSFAAAQQAAMKETSGSQSRLAYAPNGTLPQNANTNPTSWGQPNGTYSLVVELPNLSTTVASCTSCVQGGNSHGCGTAWTSPPVPSYQACPAGYAGTETINTVSQYQCVNTGGIGTIQPNGLNTSTDQSNCVQVTGVVYSACSGCGTGSQTLQSWSCTSANGAAANQSVCQGDGIAPAATQSCTSYNTCQAAGTYGGCSTTCGTGNTLLQSWTCGPAGNTGQFTAAQCQSNGVAAPSGTGGTCTSYTSCAAACGSDNGYTGASYTMGGPNACGAGDTYAASASPTIGNGFKWQWTCTGGNGTANCTASETVAATCGTDANGQAFRGYPWSDYATQGPNWSNLCNQAGNEIGYTSFNGSDSGTQYGWDCLGANGGSTAHCTAPEVVDGACGTDANGQSFNTPPWSDYATQGPNWSNLCRLAGTETGTTSANASDSGSAYGWTCAGLNGGNTVACSAPENSYQWWPNAAGCSPACGGSSLVPTGWGCLNQSGTFVDNSYCNGLGYNATNWDNAVVASGGSLYCTDYSACYYYWWPTSWPSCTPACGASTLNTGSSSWECVRSDGYASADPGFEANCWNTVGGPQFIWWAYWGGGNGGTTSCADYSTCGYYWWPTSYPSCVLGCGPSTLDTNSSTWECVRTDGYASADPGFEANCWNTVGGPQFIWWTSWGGFNGGTTDCTSYLSCNTVGGDESSGGNNGGNGD